jgi:hypothetical protein
MDVLGVIQLFIPIITFAMGYFLTDIGYKRDRKLGIIREKFDRLYHPFYILINEHGTDHETGGFAFDNENLDVLKPILDHLTKNSHLATTEGQMLIWETRYHFISIATEEETIDKDKEELFGKSLGALLEHLIQEYMKSAKALGYELISIGAITSSSEN